MFCSGPANHHTWISKGLSNHHHWRNSVSGNVLEISPNAPQDSRAGESSEQTLQRFLTFFVSHHQLFNTRWPTEMRWECYHSGAMIATSASASAKLKRWIQSRMLAWKTLWNISGATVERVRSIRVLGAHLSDDLSWSLHTNRLSSNSTFCWGSRCLLI